MVSGHSGGWGSRSPIITLVETTSIFEYGVSPSVRISHTVTPYDHCNERGYNDIMTTFPDVRYFLVFTHHIASRGALPMLESLHGCPPHRSNCASVVGVTVRVEKLRERAI